LNAAFRRRVSATKLFNKPPLAILNGTSNPLGLHNEHSLFQRISIHLHYDVKVSKHLASLLTTEWQRERQALNYLYFMLSFRVANFLFANSQNKQPHFITGMKANVLHFCSFCKPTFSGATREWDALYNESAVLGSRGVAPYWSLWICLWFSHRRKHQNILV
jgi:hypothetical protein